MFCVFVFLFVTEPLVCPELSAATHTREDLTSVGVFDEAVLWRADEPNQQVLHGCVQVRHYDVVGRQLHSAAFLDLNNKIVRLDLSALMFFITEEKVRF